jgi:hypothetical protein
VECDEFGGASAADVAATVAGWPERRTRAMVAMLMSGRPIVFRLSRARLSASGAVVAAQQIADAFGRMVTATYRYEPPVRVETERPLNAKIHAGHRTRDMLPHHDAHHCSFLTPSRLDDEEFDPGLRVFGQPASVPTDSVVLYSGFVVQATGEAESITTFYDWIRIVECAFRRQQRPVSPTGTTIEAARWLGANIRLARARAADLDLAYLSTGAALGAEGDAYAMSVVEAEADFHPEDYARVAGLASITRTCPCGTCDTRAKRSVCNAFAATIGLTAPQTLATFGSTVRSAAGDYLFWCNPRLLHGALRGGKGRSLLPVTVVTGEASGDGYERWLHELWRSVR